MKIFNGRFNNDIFLYNFCDKCTFGNSQILFNQKKKTKFPKILEEYNDEIK